MITLYMIVRNSEGTVGRALASALPYVDHAVVVMAGVSTDGTADEVMRQLTSGEFREFYPSEHPEAFFPDGSLADFAAARNYALSFVPEGSHWVYLDADDELINGDKLPLAIQKLEDGAGVCALLYEYSHNEYGAPTAIQNKERLYSGRITDWHWVDRVHEWCKTDQDAPYAYVDGVYVYHHRQPDDTRTLRNERILRLMLEEDPANRRAQFHLADCLFAQQHYAEALDAFARVYQDPEIEPHAVYAVSQCAKCAIEVGDSNAAAYWSMLSIDMRPQFKDGYLLRARVAADMERWEDALFWLDQAADKREHTNQTAVSVWADDYKWNAWHVQYTALLQLRRPSEAVNVAKLALHEYPTSALWIRELHKAEEAERIEVSVKSVFQLADHFVRRGDTLNAYDLLQDQKLPMTIRQDERILALRERIWSFVRHVFEPDEYEHFYTKEVPGHEINGTSIDRYRLQPLVDSLKDARRVIEVGTGAGGPAIWMLRHLPDVEEYVGLDINPDLVEQANKAAAFHGFADKLRFECDTLAGWVSKHPTTVGSLGMPNGPKPYFDACILPEIIEHMLPQDAHMLVTQAEEVAESVMLTTPAMFCADIPPLNTDGYPRDHVKEWSLSDLEQMVFKVPRRRPVQMYKVYAPDTDDEWLHILPDGEKSQALTYPYPGFASWFAEFDNRSRHNGPVTIYTGSGPGWSPLDLETKGLGGSETMAMKMAEQFAQNNHPVCIYGDWVGVYNGVIYRHWSTFNPIKPYLGVDTWLFISSRIPAVFDEEVNADICWLWEHDVDPGADQINDLRLSHIDKVLVLSEWHKRHWLEFYPDTPESKLYVTRNAVELDDFPDLLNLNGASEKLKRERHKFIWASSADRGLRKVFEWWPDIRKMWPDATLDVFYGFETMDAMSHLPGREWLRDFKRLILAESEQPGITWHGRIPQKQLHEEMAKSQFWLYPSINAIGGAWNETYCITAVEAIGMGCVPIVADTGALRERLSDFGLESLLVPWDSPRKLWLKSLKARDLMPDELTLAQRRDVLRSLNFEDLYRDWMRLVMEDITDQVQNRKTKQHAVSQTA